MTDAMVQPEDRHAPAAEVESVIGRAAGGDEAAWRELVGLYGRRVYALIVSRVRRPDLAEEITQSVFVTVAAKLGTGGYQEVGRFESWLFRIAMNRLRDECRRQRRHGPTLDPSALPAHGEAGVRGGGQEEPGPNGAEGHKPARLFTTSDFVRLRAAMERLPDSDRDIIELRHRGELGFKELATMLNEPIGTLLARHHRALRKLRKLLEEDGVGPDRSAGRSTA